MGEQTAAPYRVLARKYRPTTFSELIGQDALVRTITNAIRTERLAHAYLLTGVRGVGKTSTARILARALNCVGPDGQGGPTPEPCGECEHCVAIAQDRHVDVIEMDAASRTGVDDIRELIDGVRYRPTSARYKIYIVDEVHMLSKQAFNALLKTLEEPPPHVKFIFATTEVRRLPVTVLSRCQRFDLRRVDMATLAEHFRQIAEQENAEIEPGAIGLIARAADGSVRDGLSLLDQAIAHGEGKATEAEVRDVLGLADRTQVFDLFKAAMRGEIKDAVELLARQYEAGADPLVVLQDLLELTHWLTRLKLVPDIADEPSVPEVERKRGRAMAEGLAMPTLIRAWQMLLKGLGEAREAPDPLVATEMTLVRLAYAADLPSPADALRALSRESPRSDAPGEPPPDAAAPATPGAVSSAAPSSGGGAQAASWAQPDERPDERPIQPPIESRIEPEAASHTTPSLESYEDVVARAEQAREGQLVHWLAEDVHVVRFRPGHIELRLREGATNSLINTLSEALREWTGTRWVIALSDEEGAPTLAEQKAARAADRRAAAEADPLVQKVLETFPGATIRDVRPKEGDEER